MYAPKKSSLRSRKRATSNSSRPKDLTTRCPPSISDKVGSKIGNALLRAVRACRNQPLEVRNGVRDDRRDQHQRERQQPIEIDHRRKRRDERRQRDDELRYRDADRVDHDLKVGRKARDELARTPFVELSQRQVQQSLEEPHAQARDEMLTAPRRQVRLSVDATFARTSAIDVRPSAR